MNMKMIETFDPLIKKIAKSFYGIEYEELMQVGRIGLYNAYNHYDKNSDTKFSTFAYQYIFGEMYNLAIQYKTIKPNRDILKITKLVEKTKILLTQKLGKEPSISDIALYLEMDENVINNAIRYTIEQYAGGNGVNREKRFELTKTEITEDGDIKFSSISKQKGQNCFYCTEKATISHNLWLLSGATSYCCLTYSDSFGENDDVYKNDTHNFTIVEYDGKFRLYDLSMQNVCRLQNDCIENMLNGKGLKVDNVANPGIYVKTSQIENDFTK